VDLAERDNTLVLRVSDDGRGFDPLQRHEGFGLLGMAERIDLLGGTFQVESRAGEGTVVHATLPVSRRREPGEAEVVSLQSTRR
jgi:signal transduction histidine kinase